MYAEHFQFCSPDAPESMVGFCRDGHDVAGLRQQLFVACLDPDLAVEHHPCLGVGVPVKIWAIPRWSMNPEHRHIGAVVGPFEP